MQSQKIFSVMNFNYIVPEKSKLRGEAQQPALVETSSSAFERGLSWSGRYFFVENLATEFEFRSGSVIQIMQPDINQEIRRAKVYFCAAIGVAQRSGHPVSSQALSER